MKRVGIIQPSFIPWKGHFDIMHGVDVFVFLDDVQYTVQDWRNRNRVKTPAGPKWLTVPVHGGIKDRLCEIRVNYDHDWRHKHLSTLQHAYGKAPFFERYYPALREEYGRGHEKLVELDVALTLLICGWLGVDGTEFVRASRLGVSAAGGKDERVIGLIKAVGGDSYLSGASARDYMRLESYAQAGIEVSWQDPGAYPEYPQLHGPFLHEVSVLDLLFMTGPEAPGYIWGRYKQGGGDG